MALLKTASFTSKRNLRSRGNGLFALLGVLALTACGPGEKPRDGADAAKTPASADAENPGGKSSADADSAAAAVVADAENPGEKPGDGADAAKAPVPVAEKNPGENSRAAAESLTNLVPADAMMVGAVSVPGLVRAFETFTGEKVPPTPEEFLSHIGKLAGEKSPPPPELLALVKAIDPVRKIQRVLLAGDEVDQMILIEGKFEDQSKIIGDLRDGGWLPAAEPEKIDGLDAYNLFKVSGPNKPYLAFLSDKRALVAPRGYFQKVVALSRGEGTSINSNETLNGLRNASSSGSTLWAAVSFPDEIKKAMSGAGGGAPGPGGEAPVAGIKLDAGMVSVDMKGKDLSVRVVGAAPSAEDAENSTRTLGVQLGGLTLAAVGALGTDAIGLMGKLTPKSEGKNVVVAFTLNEDELTKLAEKVASTALTGRNIAWRVQCTNNLKQIYFTAVAYADKKYQFPLAEGDAPRAHDSLNLLVRSRQGKGLESRLFVCPAGEAVPAETDEDEILPRQRGQDSSEDLSEDSSEDLSPAVPAETDEDGKFHLDEDTLDYAWAKVRLKPYIGKAKPLAACTHHDGFLIVLYTDSSVRAWELDIPDPLDFLDLDPDTGLPAGLGR